MPCFRGIDISVVATQDSSEFPEFPHPDGSSARFGGPNGKRHSGSIFLSPRRRQQGDDGLAGDTPRYAERYADPTISVYIPSAAETNFFFRYHITQPPVGHRYLCFRVIINGRDIVSWGIDLDESLCGATHQALFQPSITYQRCINGVLMTQYGIESRCFRFVSCGANKTSVADDGGLIEVKVFRARARSRRAPQPDHYRGRGRYGISLVSNGLLEDPQTASYYDYHLVDASDCPYASFRFHYRSWGNLRSLQLAPDEKPEFLCTSPSRVTLKRNTTTPKPISQAADADLRSCLKEFGLADTAMGGEAHDAIPRSCTRAARHERPLPQLPTMGKSMLDLGTFSDNETSEHDADVTTVDEAHSVHVQRARALSAVSSTSATSKVSIATSLQAYADGDDGLLVDTMEHGSAVEVGAVFRGKPECHMPPDAGKRSASSLSSWYSLTHVAPFTDDLRKRPCSPNKPRRRGLSAEYSPRSRGSPIARRLHGGSLDSASQLALGSSF